MTEENKQQTEEQTEQNVQAQEIKTENQPIAHDPNAFNWDADEAGFGNYSKDERAKIAEVYAETLSTLKAEQIVKGKVVSLSDREVVLDVGYKSDGVISRNEFKDLPDLKVGDEVDVYVENTEDSFGQLVLSHKRAQQEGAWGDICKAMEEETVLTGQVKSRTKGGLVVDVMGIDAFLPGSQIDTKPIRDYDQYVGKNMEFRIVKVNETFRNVVISHKVLIEDDIELQKSEILSSLEKGQVLEGVVKNMTSFGVFVDLGGVDGLLHITDISWGRINHPEEVLQLDQKINIVVLDFDDDKKRISLGLKQLSEHPWDTLDESIQVGAKVSGKIVTVADYGAFLEIKPGVEGLIHVSEMSWSQHLRNPSDFLNVGDESEAIVLTFEKEERKISLGIKQLTPDPWTEIQTKYPSGSKHTGIVKNLTSYGLFVELEDGVDGLVHVSDLSWTKKIKHPAEFTKKDAEIEVVVLEIDAENRRLSLGHKQLEENPWDAFESVFAVGTKHEVTILEINDKGANVQMPYGIEAFIPKRHLVKEDGSLFKEDEAIEAEVIEFNKETKSLILSHAVIWKSAETASKEIEKKKKEKGSSRSNKNVNQNAEKSSFGELDAFSELKDLFKDQPQTKEAKPKAEKKAETPKADKVKKEETPETEAPKAEAPKAEKIKEETTEVKAPKAEKEAKAEKPATKAKKSAGKDDLKKLAGVGPAFEKRLNAAGIKTYADMAALKADAIAAIEEKDNITSTETWEKWIEEAKALKS